MSTVITPDALRAWRKRLGLSQSQAAALLPIAAGTLKNYEQGIRPIPAVLARAMRDLARELEGRA